MGTLKDYIGKRRRTRSKLDDGRAEKIRRVVSQIIGEVNEHEGRTRNMFPESLGAEGASVAQSGLDGGIEVLFSADSAQASQKFASLVPPVEERGLERANGEATASREAHPAGFGVAEQGGMDQTGATCRVAPSHEVAASGPTTSLLGRAAGVERKEYDAETRRRVLKALAETPAIQISQYQYSSRAIFPPHLRKLSRLFTAIRSICKFNGSKDIMTIFHKSKKCIENLLSRNVSKTDFERLNWLSPESFEFRKIEILHFGERLESFTIGVLLEDANIIDDAISAHLKAETLRGGAEEEIEIPRRPLFGEEKGVGHADASEEKILAESDRSNDAERVCREDEREVGRKKGLSVLERIREKERARKESFMAQHRELDELEGVRQKIESYFTVEKKRAERVSEVVRILRIPHGRETLQRLCLQHTRFSMRVFEDETFLLLQEQRKEDQEAAMH